MLHRAGLSHCSDRGCPVVTDWSGRKHIVGTEGRQGDKARAGVLVSS
jgi:hypothetical protein